MKISAHAPMPNPNATSIHFKIGGRADAIELRLYSKAMLCVGVWSLGGAAPGWNSLGLPNWRVSNGLYYYRLEASRGGQQGPPSSPGRLYVLR